MGSGATVRWTLAGRGAHDERDRVRVAVPTTVAALLEARDRGLVDRVVGRRALEALRVLALAPPRGDPERRLALDVDGDDGGDPARLQRQVAAGSACPADAGEDRDRLPVQAISEASDIACYVKPGVI